MKLHIFTIIKKKEMLDTTCKEKRQFIDAEDLSRILLGFILRELSFRANT